MSDELIVKLNKLERIVGRLSRRSRKVAKAIVTPFPISNCSFGEDVKGDVLKYMFPTDGVITKGIVRFGNKLKGQVEVTMTIESDSGIRSDTMKCDKVCKVINPDKGVLSGDRLTVSVSPIGEAIIKEVWISFLWTPVVCETSIKNYLIDELDKNAKIEE